MITPEAPKDEKAPGGSRGVGRVADVIALLAEARRPIAAGAIARRRSIPRSSTYQILNALVARGFAERNAAGFVAGPRLREITRTPSIARAMNVLECFDHGTPQLDLPELAVRADITGETLEELLLELVDAGLLVVSNGRYALGVAVAALAARSRPLEMLRTVARPVLLGLRDETGETANLVVRDRDHLVYLDQIESLQPLRHAGWVGRRIPIDRGAASQALDGAPGAPYAQDVVEVGVTGVAARVPGLVDPLAALSVTAPTVRMTERRIAECQDAVRAAAVELAMRLPSGAERSVA